MQFWFGLFGADTSAGPRPSGFLLLEPEAIDV